MSTLDLLLRSTRVPELRRRLLFSLGVLALYRLGVFITVPGVDRSVMQQVVHDQGGVLGMFNLLTVLTLTTGTSLVMWLGEQVTERGIGNGTSLILFASIVSGIPRGIFNYFAANAGEVQPLVLLLLVAFLVACIALVVLFERAQRRIPIQYARRQLGRRSYGGQAAHLPLKVNMASMIPPIFASSLLTFPQLLANTLPFMARFSGVLNRGDWIFNTLFAGLTIFFSFFYTSVTFQPVEVADHLKKQQANIPGLRPGRQTAEYIDGVVRHTPHGDSGLKSATLAANGWHSAC